MVEGDGLAVVTGAASGIGRASAFALAERGMRVVVADLDEDGARETAQELSSDASAYGVDVADTGAVQSFAAAVLSDLGTPDAVVNCAGWDETHRFLDTEPEFWERVVAINFTGVVAVTHAFAGAMVERGGGRIVNVASDAGRVGSSGGRIVNVASDAGRVGSSGEAVYAGAKGGVIAFTKSVARELARHGVTANAVCPGPTDTPLFRAQPERLQRALERAVPMGRLAKPGDIADAIAFFASAEAGFVTGQVLSVSGGLTMAG